jgi:hypothetical protein
MALCGVADIRALRNRVSFRFPVSGAIFTLLKTAIFFWHSPDGCAAENEYSASRTFV